MNELPLPGDFSRDMLAKLVGVIDLKDQLAVRAVAGNRNHYQPVSFCKGDPVSLANHYRDLGVSELYVADLDAIEGQGVQTNIIQRLGDLTDGCRMVIDIGWTDNATQSSSDWIGGFANLYSHSQWVAATESMNSSSSLEQLVQLVSADRTLLGLDFYRGNLVGRDRLGNLNVGDWIDIARRAAVTGSVILDLDSIGMSSGPTTTEICHHVSSETPEWTLFSGGGIRSAQDVHSLIAAGCNRCLVATALHGIL